MTEVVSEKNWKEECKTTAILDPSDLIEVKYDGTDLLVYCNGLNYSVNEQYSPCPTSVFKLSLSGNITIDEIQIEYDSATDKVQLNPMNPGYIPSFDPARKTEHDQLKAELLRQSQELEAYNKTLLAPLMLELTGSFNKTPPHWLYTGAISLVVCILLGLMKIYFKYTEYKETNANELVLVAPPNRTASAVFK